MTAKRQLNQERNSNLYAAIGRIVTFLVLASAICALAKTFVCGRNNENCPRHNKGESDGCSSQEASAESTRSNVKKEM